MNHHHHTGSLRHNGRHRAIQTVQTIDVAEKTERRSAIISPGERRAVVRMFLFYSRSITKLADIFRANESAIENVIRQEVYRVYPPMKRAA
jgi:hypothetical protein